MRVWVGGLCYLLLCFVLRFLLGSNLGRHTKYPEIYSGFPQSLDANSGIVPELSHHRFLPIHYLALALPFDAMNYWQRHEVTEKYSQPFYGIRRFVPVPTTARNRRLSWATCPFCWPRKLSQGRLCLRHVLGPDNVTRRHCTALQCTLNSWRHHLQLLAYRLAHIYVFTFP
jgi:hypothetical protein